MSSRPVCTPESDKQHPLFYEHSLLETACPVLQRSPTSPCSSCTAGAGHGVARRSLMDVGCAVACGSSQLQSGHAGATWRCTLGARNGQVSRGCKLSSL